MQDRVATHPNRWKLTPVAGEADVYDFERADEPVVAGTPLDKATFLTDATAAAIAALTGNTPALPTEALDELASVFDTIGTTGVAHVEAGSYIGTGQRGASNPNTLTFTYEPRLLFVCVSGTGFKNDDTNAMLWVYPNTKADRNRTVTVSDNQISWYSTTSADYQANISGTTYIYLAITVN